MKKNIICKLTMLFVVALFAACSEDEGTDVGSDGTPRVTVYQYTPDAPYNADNDVRVRFAVNNKVESLYYLAEAAADKAERLKQLGETGYAAYVVDNGTKVDIPEGELSIDVVITDMKGEYSITAVAVSGGAKTLAATTFVGYDWVKVKNAYSQMNVFTGEEVETELQYASVVKLYRVLDPWGTGVSIVFSWDGGERVTFANSSIATGWMHPNYGEVTFNPSSGNSGYNAAYNAFVFSGEWTVSAGSFGAADGVVYLEDLE